MKKIVIFTLLALITFSLNAQTRDAQAVKLLDQVANAYKKPSQLKFDYHLKNTQENISHKESGSVYINGDKYNLSLMNNTQVYDGKKVYNISSEDKEVTITSNPSKEELLTPTKILNSYKKGYHVKSSGTTTINGKNASLITLTPTDKNAITSKIELAIDSKNKDLLKVTEHNKQGSVTTITINTINKGVIIPNSIFSFKESYYKGKGYIITPL